MSKKINFEVPKKTAEPEKEGGLSERESEDGDLADRQHRDVQAHTMPSADDVKDRLVADRRRGSSTPLRSLAYAEAGLHAQSAALAKLSSSRQQPDKNLLAHQLARTVNTSHAPKTIASQLKGDAVQLYSSLGSKDPTESLLDRITVAASNSVMDCYARAVETANPKAVDIYLRHAVKGTNAVINLVEAKARRRGPTQITVGKVNVEAGGQAIVGNVEARQRNSKKKTRSDSSLANATED